MRVYLSFEKKCRRGIDETNKTKTMLYFLSVLSKKDVTKKTEEDTEQKLSS